MTQIIYKITNLVNDKFYVGSTVNKKVRFREHRKQLHGDRHHCKHLQAAWNKYGESKFSFDVVEVVPDGAPLHVVEDWWLQEDLERYPSSSIGQIHQRIGQEIPRRRLKSLLGTLVSTGEVSMTGKLKGSRYGLSK